MDGFFLGAGFSRAISEHMPLMEDLSNELELSFPTLYNQLLANYFEFRKTSGNENFRMISGGFEAALDYVATEHPWLSPSDNLRNKALYLEMVGALEPIIIERQKTGWSEWVNKLPPNPLNTPTSPDFPWPYRLILHWLYERSPVVTLNYDLLVEAFINHRIDGNYDECYPQPLPHLATRGGQTLLRNRRQSLYFDLFKLHGSVNWIQHVDGTNGEGQGAVYETSLASILATGTSDPVWIREQKGLRGEMSPLIIPPTFQKSAWLGNQTVRYLWKEAANRLKLCERIYFIGYSLPETDLTIRYFLNAEVLNDRTEMVLVNKYDCSVHFRKLLRGNFDHKLHCFGDACLEKFVSNLSGIQNMP
jgi:hypothetical protein